jgi:hypothetical protein
MAIGNSGLFIPTFRDIFDLTQLPIDFDAETHKVALFTDTVTPNYSTDTAYGVAPYNANEIPNGSGYTTGGATLTTTTLTESPAGTLMWDAADVAWAASTITNAKGCLIYADASAGNEAICLVTFTTPYSTTNGTFTIQWASGGIFTIDLTP